MFKAYLTCFLVILFAMGFLVSTGDATGCEGDVENGACLSNDNCLEVCGEKDYAEGYCPKDGNLCCCVATSKIDVKKAVPV